MDIQRAKPILKRHITSWGAASMALVGANASLLVLGTLMASFNTATIPFLAIAMIISWLAAPAFVELVLMYPNKVGGVAAVCLDAFRPYNPLLANIAGTCYWLGWIAGVGFAAIFVATGLQILFFPTLSVNWIASILTIVLTLLSFFGLRWVQRLSIPIAIIAIIFALASVLIPLLTGHFSWQQATHFELTVPYAGKFGEITSVAAAFYLILFVSPCMENSLCYVGEMVDPQKSVPRAILITLLIATFYFAICPFVWLGTLGSAALAKDHLVTELMPTYAPILGHYAAMTAAFFIVFNLLLTVSTPLSSVSRTLMQLAHDGLLPRIFGLQLRSGSPWFATLLGMLAILTVIWFGAPTWIIASTNFSYILSISLVGIAVWLLRLNEPDAPRLYRAPKGFITLGLLLPLICVLATIFGFQQYGLGTMILGVAFAFYGIILFLWRKISDRRQQKLSLVPQTLYFKLSGILLIVLMIDAIGYLTAVSYISREHQALVTALEDIFVIVALITLSFGFILPGMVAHTALQVSQSAKRLAKGTLADFSRAMQALGSGDLEKAYAQIDIVPVSVHSNDELGEMADSFNQMQEEIKRSALALNDAREGLREARKKVTESHNALQELNRTLEARVKDRTQKMVILNEQLVTAARYAGMTDIATSVIHNVGNVLNSISTSISMIRERLLTTEMKNFAKLDELLQSQEDNLIEFLTEDIKGKHIITYFHMLSEAWSNEELYLVNELKSLEKNVYHIREIITAQQDLGTVTDVTREVIVERVFEEALSLVNLTYKKSLPVEIIRDYQSIPLVIIDKIKLLQILVNLIKNGLDSLVESSNQNKKLILRIQPKNKNFFMIQVIDDGVGIAQENLTKIFSHGFTTKKNGHGFGLHSSGIAAKTMDGSLTAESTGLGKGAKFTLVLPYNPKSLGNKND